MPKINQLPIEPFTDDKINHCFYVENMNKPTMKLVELKSVFDWIKQEAITNGLTVKMEGKQIMFITGNKNK